MSAMVKDLLDNSTHWQSNLTWSYDQVSQYSGNATIPFLVTVSSAFAGFLILVSKWLNKSPYPLVNGKAAFELSANRPKKEFMRSAWKIISTRLCEVPDKIFRVLGDVGEIHILPPKYAYEIRNHDDLSFTQAAYRWYYGHLPGFEGFREGTNESHIMKHVAHHQLTHQLMLVTKPVSDETAAALADIYTESREWRNVTVREANLMLMARVTSRVFLGEKLCRDPDWLRVTTTYSVIGFRAVEELRLWPAWMRSTVLWFLPQCTAARNLVKEARRLIDPLLEERRAEKIEAAKRGEKAEWNDAIDWLDSLAHEKGVSYDPAASQLSLSTAALHSTTDFFTQCTLDIASNPEILDALREEIVTVLGKGGWTKNSLYNLKLMDSVLKESQRMKPIAIASMRRYTTAEVKLSDGNVLPKNKLTLVSCHQQWDNDSYPNADKWDGYRFLRMRSEPGKENKAQLVSVSPDHMGFGYGLHACPGRFFAAEEIKIALCHMLMKYDFKPVPGSDLKPRRYGMSMTANPTAQLSIRRRDKDIQSIPEFD